MTDAAPPRARWSGAVLALVALLLAAGCQPTPAAVAGRPAVTAGSTAVGSAARSVTDTGSATRTGQEWTAVPDGPAWIQLSWSRPEPVRKIVLANGGPTGRAVRSGYLTFSDGSSLQVRLSDSDPVNTLAVTPREVTWLRFTASALGDGAGVAALAEIVVDDAISSDDVVTDSRSDGNAAPTATVSAAQSAAVSDPTAVVDGDRETSGIGDAWLTSSDAPAWVQLTWARPRELATIQLVGSRQATSGTAAGELHFSDGSIVPVGGVVNDPAHPTIVAFMPRSTRSVRFVVTKVDGSGLLALAELRAFQIRATPERTPAAPAETELVAPPCPPPAAAVGIRGAVTVACPTANTVATGPVTLPFVALGVRTVTATVWAAEGEVAAGPEVSAPVASDGTGAVRLDLSAFPRGPLTVRLAPSGSRTANATYLQLYNASVPFPGPDAEPPSALAAGRTLVYADEFSALGSTSPDGTGADYSSAKPEHGGPAGFGEAIFADPAQNFGNLGVVDKRYLRMAMSPRPPELADPQGWSRQHIGALLASARKGGSGFAAQYGYFETRMLTPAGKGIWPAFWMLPSPNLVSADAVGSEVDAVELYGHDPRLTCHSTHAYADGKDFPRTKCFPTFSSIKDALGWHTYGVWVTPVEIVYYVDGRQVFTAPQINAGDRPLFFLLNLTLGGGWPVELTSTGNRATMYVDYVRVYV